MSTGRVEAWFGEGFSGLHPLLQRLHRQGGVLEGEVELATGAGLAGWLGRRLAGKLGIPLGARRVPLRVDIHCDESGLHWNRRFADSATLVSLFRPVGHWPDGHWEECTGALRLALKVDTRDGGWRWVPMAAWVRGIRIPLALLPRTTAYKRIECGRYHFYVGFSLPGLGELFSYSGGLELLPAGRAGAA
ncbi:hypothetical protein thsps21_26840 [Pseudomonas sp. No.21]|uniref:DUF4166 domain-containing protein n=1 Tax=Pseudomonas tohonis TaxID=2725477 RepID=UPI001F2900FB|nr:DUF4166 domain-containing protein [Pseudomonas tohonis]GJN45172.1 hypothetical protein TUM20249_11580 [Pseudomonas tohonis]